MELNEITNNIMEKVNETKEEIEEMMDELDKNDMNEEYVDWKNDAKNDEELGNMISFENDLAGIALKHARRAIKWVIGGALAGGCIGWFAKPNVKLIRKND